jgi:serine/threonine-protein kinase
MSDSLSTAADKPRDSDLSGRQIGGYRLLRRLGQGAMAEVYLAEQVSLGRQVAFKVLRLHLASDATYVQRFDQEARAAAQLVHPNIVQIYEVGCVEGVHFIAQEYVQGVNLSELLVRRGPPSLAKSLAVLRQVAAALDKAAHQGIVHRDIKPENIMLAASGEVKVADFGLARVNNQEANNLTQVGVTMGTPLYMSPEQVEGRPLDPRSDIYSLGVTGYQLLSGEPPFRGETALSIALQHLKAQPARLENLRPDLPPAVCRVVHKMLAKEPAERYPSARELLRDLRAATVELFPDNVDDEVELPDGEFAGVVEARRDATERLATAMRTTAMPAVRRKRATWRIGLMALMGLLLGTGLAYGLRPRPLILAEDEAEVIPHYQTAAQQYWYAVMRDSEAAWKSVPEYFAGDTTYVLRAKQGLARWYLREIDFPSALAIFDQFAGMSNVEEEYQAFGLAGQAIVYNRLGKYKESADKLAQLWPKREKLESEMRGLAVATFRSNRRALGETQTTQPWNEWFEMTNPGEPTPPPNTPAPSASRRGDQPL